jgi:hypothetical protein
VLADMLESAGWASKTRIRNGRLTRLTKLLSANSDQRLPQQVRIAPNADVGIGSMARRQTPIALHGIRVRPTEPASPWQNGVVERLIGSIQRECVDHMIVQGEVHLRSAIVCTRWIYRHRIAAILRRAVKLGLPDYFRRSAMTTASRNVRVGHRALSIRPRASACLRLTPFPTGCVSCADREVRTEVDRRYAAC